jgi:hypothetical protein
MTRPENAALGLMGGMRIDAGYVEDNILHPSSRLQPEALDGNAPAKHFPSTPLTHIRQ